MKTKIFKLAVIMLVVAGSFCSCDKWIDKKINEKIEEKLEKQRTTMPPETQTGADTFGCYVNGALCVEKRGSLGFGISTLNAIYRDNNDIFEIYCSGTRGFIKLHVSNPAAVNVKKPLDWARYHDSWENNIGEVMLTKFDTVNKIASGIFAFDIQRDSIIVQITQGRFDVRW